MCSSSDRLHRFVGLDVHASSQLHQCWLRSKRPIVERAQRMTRDWRQTLLPLLGKSTARPWRSTSVSTPTSAVSAAWPAATTERVLFSLERMRFQVVLRGWTCAEEHGPRSGLDMPLQHFISHLTVSRAQCWFSNLFVLTRPSGCGSSCKSHSAAPHIHVPRTSHRPWLAVGGQVNSCGHRDECICFAACMRRGSAQHVTSLYLSHILFAHHVSSLLRCDCVGSVDECMLALCDGHNCNGASLCTLRPFAEHLGVGVSQSTYHAFH